MFIWQNVLFLSLLPCLFSSFPLFSPKKMQAISRGTPGCKHHVTGWTLVRGVSLLLKEESRKCLENDLPKREKSFNQMIRNQKEGDSYSTLTYLKTLNKLSTKANRLFRNVEAKIRLVNSSNQVPRNSSYLKQDCYLIWYDCLPAGLVRGCVWKVPLKDLQRPTC